MVKKQIFISHTSEEADFAKSIQVWIKEILDTYIDLFISTDNGVSIPLGTEWSKKIKESLENTSIILVLVSHASKNRKWIYFEAGAGYIRDIPVIPICIGGITKAELPSPLNLLQAMELPNKNYEKILLSKIIEVSTLELPKSFYKVVDLHKLKFPKRQLLPEKNIHVLKIEKGNFQEGVLEAEVKLKMLDSLIHTEKEFTISELEIKSKLKGLKLRRYILKILEEFEAQGLIQKYRSDKKAVFKITINGKLMLEQIKKTYAVRPIYRPEGDGST